MNIRHAWTPPAKGVLNSPSGGSATLFPANIESAFMPKQVDDPDYHHENHTAAQTCGWTANSLRGEGTCYKHAFYGIRSHRCIQMTPVVRCNERCVFCWRDHAGHTYELDGVEWDDPEAVVDASISLQKKLLSGFGGNDDVPRERFEEAMEPRHVAISLDGEPTLYPHLPELLEAFHDRGLTTFLVSNGTRPEVLRECDPTQLYVSVDAPERATTRGRNSWTRWTCSTGKTRPERSCGRHSSAARTWRTRTGTRGSSGARTRISWN
jgi:organic radical activating enzyme